MMIEPNFRLLLWIILLYLLVGGFLRFTASIALYGEEKDTKWGIADLIDGILMLISAMLVILL